MLNKSGAAGGLCLRAFPAAEEGRTPPYITTFEGKYPSMVIILFSFYFTF